MINRRNFLSAVGGAALAAPFTDKASGATSVPIPELVSGAVRINGAAELPAPSASGIEHIVVVTMENRSFDHFLGWLRNADGMQAGLSYTDKSGVSYNTHLLAGDYEGCGFNDPDHSYNGGRTAYDNGRMDGFLRAGNNDRFSIGYYSEPDLPFLAGLARNYTVCDRYFASILSSTFPNRMFMWAAQTDRLGNSLALSSLTTIFDRLGKAGVSHKYYFSNVPFLALWGLKYIFSTDVIGNFFSHAADGTLPAVSFVDPTYTILDDGTGNDDHPHSDIRNGDAFLAKVYNALVKSPAWKNTVLIIDFDEWGGFFDHVAPPRVPAANNLDTDQVNGQVLLGFRLPVIVASPFTRNVSSVPQVSHTVFDNTSILKLIEWRWGLAPLSRRDASPLIGNLATIMNFGAPESTLPSIQTPSTVFAKPCFGNIFSALAQSPEASSVTSSSRAAGTSEWDDLATCDSVRAWAQHPNFKGKIRVPTAPRQ